MLITFVAAVTSDHAYFIIGKRKGNIFAMKKSTKLGTLLCL